MTRRTHRSPSHGESLGLGTILLAPTPAAWVDAAVERWPELLLDHASCEKKAASTALSLIFTYPEDRPLCAALSRVAREELRHFEQVESVMHELGVRFERRKPGRYGAGLRALLRTANPGRKLDLLLTAALIEARSCERFRLLAPRLFSPLAELYGRLERSEARHFELYLEFARLESVGATAEAADTGWGARLLELAAREAQLATLPDTEFRFHSGAPGCACPCVPISTEKQFLTGPRGSRG